MVRRAGEMMVMVILVDVLLLVLMLEGLVGDLLLLVLIEWV
jgi:hypothetical protein